MPLLTQEPIGNDGLWGIWSTTETTEELLRLLTPNGPDADYLRTVHHPERFHQTLASRVLAQALLRRLDVQYAGVEKDSAGKPLLVGCPYYISLSHTEGYAAAVLHRRFPVGIDIELVKEKLVKVAPRVFTEAEREYAHDNLFKTAVYWCAKEAVFKMGAVQVLSLRDIRLHDFRAGEAGTLFGRIEQESGPIELEIFYRQMLTFIMAFCIDNRR
jgi:phosphopantetheinyl transferase